MGVFDVYVFLTHCFVGNPIKINDKVEVIPYKGIGVVDFLTLVENYIQAQLGQPIPPNKVKTEISASFIEEGASTIVIFRDLEAKNEEAAILLTEDSLLLFRDILAMRQQQRGNIAGFLTIQKDRDPYKLYYHPRRPYAILRKITHLPIYSDQESDIFINLTTKAMHSPLFRVYLALYADTTAYSDSMVTEISIETRLLKLWSLLEALAHAENAKRKKEKVRILIERNNLDLFPNYNDFGEDLIDIVYKWRNIIAHDGGCNAATSESDKKFCQDVSEVHKQILDDFDWLVRSLLENYNEMI